MSLEKIVASCRCGEQEIETEKLINEFGYLSGLDKWQCPKCWEIVFFEVKKEQK